MTNGVGAVLGSLIAGYAIDHFFTDHACNDGVAICKDWYHIWMTFAAYALVTAVAFAVLFKHKHEPAAFGSANAHLPLGEELNQP
jgi:NHS family xanthosine MFS transporter